MFRRRRRRRCSVTIACILLSMSKRKGSEPVNQTTSSQSRQWSKEDRKAIADFFALLIEMEIENNVTKERTHEDAHK